MSFKFLIAGLVVGVIGVSSALASPPADKGKPPATGPGCKPRISVILKGTLASTPGASATALSVNVKSGNRWARDYIKATQPLSVVVNADTKVRRQGGKTLSVLLKDDRVLIQARVCKADLDDGPTTLPALTASKVIAHPAKAAKDEDKGKKGDDKSTKDDDDKGKKNDDDD